MATAIARGGPAPRSGRGPPRRSAQSSHWVVFAFTTIVAWSYYGGRCAEYLFGVKVIMPYRYLWVILLFVGAVANLGIVWLIADILNALMAIPNLIALLALSGTIFAVTKSYFERERAGD